MFLGLSQLPFRPVGNTECVSVREKLFAFPCGGLDELGAPEPPSSDGSHWFLQPSVQEGGSLEDGRVNGNKGIRCSFSSIAISTSAVHLVVSSW